MKAILVLLESSGLAFLVGKLSEHVTFAYWTGLPPFYRTAALAALVAALAIAMHDLRQAATGE